MSKFSLLVLLVLLIGCNQNPECISQQNTKEGVNSSAQEACPVPEEPDMPDEGLPPVEADLFDAEIEFNKFEKADEDKVYVAIEIIKKVVASKEFKSQVYNFTYAGKKQFVDNKGYTNEQIYQILLDGRESLYPETDNSMDLGLELYYSNRNVIGYTYPNIKTIFLNTKYFYPYTKTQVAGNLFHEWTHKLGFEHAAIYSVKRDSSVPYALGYLIEKLGKKYE